MNDAVFSWIAIGIACAATWFLIRRRTRTSRKVRSPDALLLRICRGNREQAERLVDGEMRRTPGISRSVAVERAIQQYSRDNR